MTDKLKYIYRSFIVSPDTWLFCFFLTSIPLSVRKIIYTHEIRSSFNEYASAYIYLSDIFLIMTFLAYALHNKKCNLSNSISLIKQVKLFHVEQFMSKFWKCSTCLPDRQAWNNITQKTYAHIVNKYWLLFPLVAVLFSFISILWTTDRYISTFRSVKLLEFSLLYFYVIHIVPRLPAGQAGGTIDTRAVYSWFKNTIFKLFHVEQFKKVCNYNQTKEIEDCSTWNSVSYNSVLPSDNNVSLAYESNNESSCSVIVPRGTIVVLIACIIIIFNGLLQSIVGILQFLLQKSLGLLWLKESIISANMPGVAKILFNGHTYVRAYGLFPHPNVFGGYLVFSILLTLFFTKLFHVEQFEIAQFFRFGKKGNTKNVPRGTFIQLIFMIQCIAILLTFSKSSILGLFAALLYLKVQNVPRGTFYNIYLVIKESKLFHVEHFKKKVLILLICFFVFLLIKPDWNSLFMKSLEERNFYLNVSRGTIVEHPLFGIGAGQFIFQIDKNKEVADWQFQPVHNVFLLIASEYGLFFAVGFMFFLLQIFVNCSMWNNLQAKSRNEIVLYLKVILLSFVFIMLFDHYLWDIQQGSLMLWLVMGLVVGLKIKN